jgi:hypothetical protein
MADRSTVDFSFDMGGLDRAALIAEAESIVRLGNVPLGGGDAAPAGGAGGLLDLLNDVAEFAEFPVVHQITAQELLSQGAQVPLRYENLAERFDFYWLYFPTVLFPRRGWAFNRIEARIVMMATGHGPEQQPKAIQILPQQKFQTLLELSDRLELKLDQNPGVQRQSALW